jgi:hypothetical protein
VPSHEGCRLPLNDRAPPGEPVGPSPTAMTHPLRSTAITAASSLIRGSPPLSGASVFRPCGCRRLCLFPWHHRTGSHVPCESPNESHASCKPDITWPIGRSPPCCSQGTEETPVLMPSNPLSMLRQRFTSVRLSHPHMTQSYPRLFHDVHHRGF